MSPETGYGFDLQDNDWVRVRQLFQLIGSSLRLGPSGKPTFTDLSLLGDLAVAGDVVTTGSGRFDGGIGVGIDPLINRRQIYISETLSPPNIVRATLANLGTGDAVLHLYAGSDWAIGVDNSDGDKLIIAQGAVLGSNVRLSVTTAGAFDFQSGTIACGDITGGTYNGLTVSTAGNWSYLVGAGAIDSGLDIAIPNTAGNHFFYGFGGTEHHKFGNSSQVEISDDGDIIMTGNLDLSNDTARILIGTGGLSGNLGADAIIGSDGTHAYIQIESPSAVFVQNPKLIFKTIEWVAGVLNFPVISSIVGGVGTDGIFILDHGLYIKDVEGSSDGFVNIYDKATITEAVTLTYNSTSDYGQLKTTGTTIPLRIEPTGDLFLNPALTVVLSKTSGKGIKVDTATPTFGWRDLQGDILIKTAGANDPDYSDYASTGIYRHQFKNTAMTQVFNSYHIPHDYVPGTEVHVHIHWSQTTIDTGGAAGAPGVAKWYFDANYSKGHDRGAFPAAVVTVFVTPTASGTIRKHLIAEVQLSTSGQVGGQDLEPDGIVTVRTYRDSDDEADTLNERPWVHHIDIHYQSTNIATKAKAFDFYT